VPSRRLRAALAAALAAPLLVGPVVAEAVSVPLRCKGVAQTGLWQRLQVEDFRGVEGVRTGTAVTTYSVDAARPERLLVTNGNTVKQTLTHGCAWRDVLVLGAQGDEGVPLSGTTSTVVATASLPGGGSLAAVREGTGPASRPHIASSASGADGTWRETSAGLPVQGSPRLLEPAGDGRTAYLTLSPAADSQSGGSGTLPSLPDGAGPAGFLYASTDGGRTWTQRTTVAALPSGSTGFDALAVDTTDPDLLYAVSDGRLVVSRDGGRSLEVVPDVVGVTAVEPMKPNEVAVLAGTLLLHSTDGGRTFAERSAPAGAASAAYREGDGSLVVEADGQLFTVPARSKGGPIALDAGVPVTPGSARGDRAEGGSFHALAGNQVLRYVDPVPVSDVGTPRAPGDLAAAPPRVGRMDPPSRSVTLPVGESREVDFSLALPPNPTPLDLYLLIDVSLNMGRVLDDVKKNLSGVATDVEREGIDLSVGLGTIANGPRDGEAPYPDVDPRNPDYRKPDLYRRVRPIGPVDDDLRAALAELQIQRPPQDRSGGDPPEGQLIGLEQLIDGKGIEDDRFGGEARQAFVVPSGQQAQFREAPGVRKIVVHATQEEFTDPYGTRISNGKPDVEYYAGRLRDEGITFLGLTVVENGESKADLQRMARLTRSLAPPGGIDCGDEILLKQGDPLVCDSSTKFTEVIGRVITSLSDRQSVALVRRGLPSLLGDVDAGALRDLDVTLPNTVPFRVRVSCVDVAAGSYSPSVDAVLRETVVATAKLSVTCTAPAAAAAFAPLRPPPPAQADPAAPAAAQPAAQVPAPPVPAPPVVQPQAQPQAQAQTQVQAQVNPMTAAMLQQQQELQLALALSADEKPSAGTQLAMVDRRRGEELRALALLSVSMAAASALGLARLRTRRSDAVRVRRAR
jgi:hypothetical protein